MSWLNDLVTLMTDAGVGTFNENIFTSTKSAVPMLPSGGATLTIVETSGAGPERTQNSTIRPAYIRPTAQFKARANSYTAARVMAQAAYDALSAGTDQDGNPVAIRNCWIVSEDGLASGWYREIVPLQEPFDSGVDDRKQATATFNVFAIRRP